MSMDLNRQQKRAMQKMGAVNDQGAPIRQPRPTVASQVKKERTSPAQYIREVRDEMRKVAWPKWPEIRRYSDHRVGHSCGHYGVRGWNGRCLWHTFWLALQGLTPDRTAEL